MADTQTDSLTIFQINKNCWKIGEGSQVSILVDSSNYYGALYEAICKAKHSLFILGWDIDSRIELMRGQEIAKADEPADFFHLICKAARENPSLQIYLNRWNYSLFFASQREPFWVRKWTHCNLSNIHVCLDGVIPMAACHHQKVVVIDDEIAFWGGMDVALGRWDWRQHHINNSYREDPSGLPDPEKKISYGPYHDIQAIVSGPVVRAFSELVRERWTKASAIEPAPIFLRAVERLPQTWPESFPPQFKNIPMVLARTIPPILGEEPVSEVLSSFIDEIAQAENFIYIENQYLACERIAKALNRQLLAKPSLRILAVSCDKPQGIMERKAMWGGRVIFHDILKKGGVSERILLAYPVSKEHGNEESIHIHSKIMIIDDQFLRLGSSNIANRSMGMDTELDVTIIGTDVESRQKIEAIRNDLIREHCGREIDDIQSIISNAHPVSTFIEDRKTSRQHLRRLDDERYRNEKFVPLARFFGDPIKPFIPMGITHILHRNKESHFVISVWTIIIFLLFLGITGLVLEFSSLSHYISADGIAKIFENLSSSPLSLLYATGLYTTGSVIFFPLTAMTGAAVAVFGPLKGIAISFSGALFGGIIGFFVGRLIGIGRLERVFGRKTPIIMQKIKGAGLSGVTLMRLLPIAPYPLVNMVFGVSGVSLINFIAGTIMGLIPGKLALAIAGDGLSKIFDHPDMEHLGYLGFGLLIWLVLMIGTQKLARYRQKKSSGQ
jgi:phospholipase D1/2